MRRGYIVSLIMALFLSQSTFADVNTMDSMSNSQMDKSCKTIVKACLSAGYTKRDGSSKGFWTDCMHPILLGKQVKGVNVSTQDATDCRKGKIDEMQKLLDELKAVP